WHCAHTPSLSTSLSSTQSPALAFINTYLGTQTHRGHMARRHAYVTVYTDMHMESAYKHTHALTYARTHTHTHTDAQMHRRTHARTHTHTHGHSKTCHPFIQLQHRKQSLIEV